jgi:glycerophosphoryl diester phosphodiesterase
LTQKKKIKLPKLIGHRGVKNLCPENTLESINKAFDLGLSYIEVDVKVSKDEIPILLHDDTLDRTTNGNGLVVNFNYEDLIKLDAGGFFYNKKTDIFIPKLVDVLCKIRNGNINIELKPNMGFEKINVRKIIELTKEIEDVEIFYSTFDIKSFIEISNFFMNSNRSFLLDSFDEYSLVDFISISENYNANICGLNIETISKEIIEKIKEKNLLVTVFSENNISLIDAKECFNIGVDSIFIDDPSELVDNYI